VGSIFVDLGQGIAAKIEAPESNANIER